MKKVRITAICLAISVALVSCLKTRAQLQSDEDPTSTSQAPTLVAANNTPPVRGGAYEVEEIKGEITRLTGRIDELERGKTDEGSQKELQQKLEKYEERIQALEQTQATLITRLKEFEANALDPEDLFEKAKKSFAAKDFKIALDRITRYLDQKGATRKAEAVFLQAECYFNLEDYKKAITLYGEIDSPKWGKSNNVPEALYKIGLAFDKLNNKQNMKIFWEDLVARFPNTSQARNAKKQMALKPKKKKAQKD